MEINGLKIQLLAPIFVDHMPPTGFLVDDPACHALWYYYLLANNARVAVGKGIEDQIIEYNAESSSVSDMPLWMDKRFNQQAKSIAFLYGVESYEAMKPFWPNVRMEIMRLGLTPPTDEMIHLKGKDIIT